MPLSSRFLATSTVLKHLEQFGNFLRGMKLADIHLQKLDSFVAVMVQGGVVDLKNLQAIPFIYPHGKGVVGKQKKRIRLALTESLNHECAGVAGCFFFEGTRDNDRKAREVVFQHVIGDALPDTFDSHFLPQCPRDQNKGCLAAGPANLHQGLHAGPARKPVVGQDDVVMKAPKVVEKLLTRADNMGPALESGLLQLI